jgi:hypothetical protein
MSTTANGRVPTNANPLRYKGLVGTVGWLATPIASYPVPEARKRESAMKWKNFPNLRLRPHAPAKGRGRLQVQIRLLLAAPTFAETASQRSWFPK